ncbi:hypothetical protein M427DRAFT_154112 [Gonapodya prolifera JEL478]|uniref:O-phosphoseryl-tRNA(Sec) selenium transferase n=1 Tax=Gonapodya prolifera (strain JEL478) TaxID=1344416 RepID=A0A139AJJ8_GONPJ|nr:hypothetical protein M427DRAFT_154112 [Gonapodya prolifera JEL478]|eukprot:KXS16986.1 hypothetical protein M427DRAFT_154112 [Gonapodya prolifera JEL478]
MDQDAFAVAGQLIGNAGYARQAWENKRAIQNLCRDLLVHRKLPSPAWPDHIVEFFLAELALCDSNNFVSNVGVGEREARVWSELVKRRNMRFAHGIGRSGTLLDIQPKAFGSSLLQTLTNDLTLDALRLAGYSKRSTASATVFPMAAGMTIAMVIRAVAQGRKEARFVVWARVDQKSAFKAIQVAGYTPLIVPLVPHPSHPSQLVLSLPHLRAILATHDPSTIACVLTTTSCFAPRAPDDLPAVARICADLDIPHVVNNVYGVASPRCAGLISEACHVGRVDAFVQSGDTNFLVPVGGAVVAGPRRDVVEQVAGMYAGRAGVGQVVDLFATLVGLGREGWVGVLEERKALFTHLHTSLSTFASAQNSRVLSTPHNDISIALSLSPLSSSSPSSSSSSSSPSPSPPLAYLGSLLFTRHVSGARVVFPGGASTVAGHEFKGWMSHIDEYAEGAYLTAATALGGTRRDVDGFVERLERCWREFGKKGGMETEREKKGVGVNGTVEDREVNGGVDAGMDDDEEDEVVGVSVGPVWAEPEVEAEADVDVDVVLVAADEQDIPQQPNHTKPSPHVTAEPTPAPAPSTTLPTPGPPDTSPPHRSPSPPPPSSRVSGFNWADEIPDEFMEELEAAQMAPTPRSGSPVQTIANGHMVGDDGTGASRASVSLEPRNDVTSANTDGEAAVNGQEKGEAAGAKNAELSPPPQSQPQRHRVTAPLSFSAVVANGAHLPQPAHKGGSEPVAGPRTAPTARNGPVKKEKDDTPAGGAVADAAAAGPVLMFGSVPSGTSGSPRPGAEAVSVPHAQSPSNEAVDGHRTPTPAPVAPAAGTAEDVGGSASEEKAAAAQLSHKGDDQKGSANTNAHAVSEFNASLGLSGPPSPMRISTAGATAATSRAVSRSPSSGHIVSVEIKNVGTQQATPPRAAGKPSRTTSAPTGPLATPHERALSASTPAKALTWADRAALSSASTSAIGNGGKKGVVVAAVERKEEVFVHVVDGQAEVERKGRRVSSGGGPPASPAKAHPTPTSPHAIVVPADLELFVNGLPRHADDKVVLKELTKQIGGIKQFTQPFPDRGFGYVRFKTGEDLKRALALRHFELDGHEIRLELKKDREERGKRGSSGRRAEGDRGVSQRTRG